MLLYFTIFLIMQKTSYGLRSSAGSSDVCSSDLLDERQAQLEDWKDAYFGTEGLPAAVGTGDAEAKPVETGALDPRLPPEAQALARLEARQEAFSAHLQIGRAHV